METFLDDYLKHCPCLLWCISGISCSQQMRIGAEGWPVAATIPLSTRENCKDRRRERERYVRINKWFWLFEDVRQLHLSCVPAEALVLDKTSDSTADVAFDQRSIYCLCWSLLQLHNFVLTWASAQKTLWSGEVLICRIKYSILVSHLILIKLSLCFCSAVPERD